MSQKTAAQLQTQTLTNIVPNGMNLITAQVLQDLLVNMHDSSLNKKDGGQIDNWVYFLTQKGIDTNTVGNLKIGTVNANSIELGKPGGVVILQFAYFEDAAMLISEGSSIRSENGYAQIDLDHGGTASHIVMSTDNGVLSTAYLSLTQAGIGIGVSAPNASSIFDVTSTTKGMLMPRMTTTQRNAISNPAESLIIFNTTLGKYQYYNGSSWDEMVTGTSGAYVAKAGDTMTGLLTLSADPSSALHASTKQYVDAEIATAITGLWDDRGNYNASVNTFPATGGSGISGAIKKGDIWTINVAGTLGGAAVALGDTVRALIDTPGQTSGNWAIAENNIGYVPISNVLNSTYILVGNSSNVATPMQASGAFTFNNTGVATITNAYITNTMLAGATDIAHGGTNSSTSLINNRLMVSSGGAIVEHDQQLENRLCFYNSNGLPTGDTDLIYDNTAHALIIGGGIHSSEKILITQGSKTYGLRILGGGSAGGFGNHVNFTNDSTALLSANYMPEIYINQSVTVGSNCLTYYKNGVGNAGAVAGSVYIDSQHANYIIATSKEGSLTRNILVEGATGNVTIDTLAGTGTRMVVANATGVISTQDIPSGGGVTTVTAISGSSDSKGASISGSNITLHPADATNGGVVTVSNQSFSGIKGFVTGVEVYGLGMYTEAATGITGHIIVADAALGIDIITDAGGINILNSSNAIPALNITGDGLGIAVDVNNIAGKFTSLTVAGIFTQAGELTDNCTDSAMTVFRDLTLNGFTAMEPIFKIKDATDATGAIYQLEKSDSNAVMTYSKYQKTYLTTSGAQATMLSMPIADGDVHFVRGVVQARRTGGSAGTAGDYASYEIKFSVRNVSGALTVSGITVTTVFENQAGWDVTAADEGGAAWGIRVSGATNNNITWSVNPLEVCIMKTNN